MKVSLFFWEKVSIIKIATESRKPIMFFYIMLGINYSIYRNTIKKNLHSVFFFNLTCPTCSS